MLRRYLRGNVRLLIMAPVENITLYDSVENPVIEPNNLADTICH